MSSKDEILDRIRQGRPLREIEYAGIPRAYRSGSTLTGNERLEVFSDRLRDYGCAVHLCTKPEIPELIGHTLAERGKARLLAAPDIPDPWLPGDREFLRDERLPYRELDGIDGVITGCEVAIASTGTIVLRHGNETGRRASSLIPDYHLCIVFAEQIVELVPEAIKQMGGLTPAPLTTIAGPSATSDIEMTRIQGVHGPRTLDVVIVR